MNTNEFAALCELLMCSDPWPCLTQSSEAILKTFADDEAKRHGYTDWIDAYHTLTKDP